MFSLKFQVILNNLEMFFIKLTGAGLVKDHGLLRQLFFLIKLTKHLL